MSERGTLIRHAATVLVGQLAVMAFGVTDTIVAGRHAEASLAALSIGSAIFISVYVALMGLLQALLPVWAEQRGAQDPARIGASFRQALYVCTAASLLGMAILLSPQALLQWTDVPRALRPAITGYLAILALALPPAMLFRMYSTLNQALGRPQLVTWLQVAALFIKLPLSIWFTFGGAGLPSMGVQGCAWATLVVNYSLLGLGVWLLRTQDLYGPLRLWQRMERPDMFIARQGTLASAGHQIASNVAAVLYMVPLSLAIAASARVSFWRGAGDEARARATVWIGFRLSAYMSIALAATLLIAKYAIAGVYSTQPAVVLLSASLLGWVALYHLADAVQTVCVFVLRSYRITVGPLVVYCVLLWGGGLGGGYVLAYRGVGPWPATHSPLSFWTASTLALAVTAAAFAWMLHRVVNRPATLPVPTQ